MQKLLKDINVLSHIPKVQTRWFQFTTSKANKVMQLRGSDWTHTLTIFSFTQTNLFLVGSLSTGYRTYFFDKHGDSLWLFERHLELSLLYSRNGKNCERMPSGYQNTIFYVNLQSRPTILFATENACESNPSNINALESDG